MTTKKLFIQVFSDIHIELWNKLPEIPVKARYLFLAGDICKLDHELFFPFFDYCSLNWEKVFYSPGNHEFYSKKRNYGELEFEYQLKLSERYKNVHYLNNNFVELDDNFNVYGSTFWTNPPFNSTSEGKLFINDYNCIAYFNKSRGYSIDLDVSYVKELSKEAHDKLQKHLNETTDKNTIVMTHFPPFRSETSNPKYLADKRRVVNSYFAWPDETIDNFNLKNVPAWISGHTHWSYKIDKNDCLFIGNQLGYKNEVGNTGLNEDGLYGIEYFQKGLMK
jgi:predicted phosphodiesterase